MRLLLIYSGLRTMSCLGENVVGAFRSLQKTMNNFRFATHYCRLEPSSVLGDKMRTFRPHLVLAFCKEAHAVTPKIRELAPEIPVGLWVVNDPYHLKDYEWMVPAYDFILTQDSGSVPFYRIKKKKPAFHVPLAVNPAHYRPMRVSAPYRSDICFIGSAWSGRVPVFDRLTPFLLRKRFILIGEGWEQLKHYALLKKGIRCEKIPPSEAAKYYNGAKIVLNIHRTSDDLGRNPWKMPALTPNNRTFDIAACRSFQLASQRRDLARFFRMGREMAGFTGADDLTRKMAHYLARDNLRAAIAAGAYRRTLREHTYECRLRHLIGILHRYLRQRRTGGDRT